MHTDTYVIIPVCNEAKAIGAVVEQLAERFWHIVCVNDGSRDGSAAAIAQTGATLINHPINLGQGAALQTGIAYALLDPAARYFITFDADGQHSAADAEKMLGYVRDKNNEVDIVLGSRFLGSTLNMGTAKRLVLKLAIIFSNLTSGVKLTDAHNGLRVFNRHVAENLDIDMPGYAHASEIIHSIAKQKFKYAELPVTITYSEYAKTKGGQPLLNAVNIAFDVLLHRSSKK